MKDLFEYLKKGKRNYLNKELRVPLRNRIYTPFYGWQRENG